MHKMRFAVLLVAALFFFSTASAIGISPASTSANGVLRGGYAEVSFRVFNTDPVPAIIELTPIGPQASWVTFEPSNSIRTEANGNAFVRVILRPPVDAANGEYRVSIRASTRPVPTDTGGGAGAQISAGVEALLIVRVSDEEKLQISVESLVAKDVEESSDGTIFVGLRNTGNVRVTPEFKIELLDKNGKRANAFEETGDDVLPTTLKELAVKMPATDLLIGSYTAVVQTFANGKRIDERSVPFSVVEIGGLRKFGEFTALVAEPSEASTGDLIKVTATFRNTGGIGLDAKFVGEVYLNQALAATLTSDELALASDETKALNVFFKPEKPGTYSVRGRVIYSKRTTDDREVQVSIKSKDEQFPWAYAVGAIVILGAIAYMFTRKGGQAPAVSVATKLRSPGKRKPPR